MKILRITNLSKQNILSIDAFLSHCATVDCAVYDFGVTEDMCEGDFYLLAYKNDRIVAVLSYLCSDIPQISALVHPDFRHQGIFKSMLSEITYDNCLFLAKENWPNCTACAGALNFSYSHSECLMEYAEPGFVKTCDTDYEICGSEYIFYDKGYEIGHASFYMTENLISIYDVFVFEEHRNKGVGHLIISTMLSELLPYDKRIILQVSDSNIPAYRLYCSCGFKTVDRVLYYRRDCND